MQSISSEEDTCPQPVVGSDLLFTSFIDFESIISELSTILLIEMKAWITNILKEWKKKNENDLNFKCMRLPWYPQQIAGKKFLSYLPEDIAAALNTYLEVFFRFVVSMTLIRQMS